MSGIIYIITTGGEGYVGSTNNFKERMNQHKSNIYNKNSKSYNCKLYKKIRENNGDWDMCIYEDNLSLNKKELCIYEQEVIDLLGATLNDIRAYRTYEQMREANNSALRKWSNNNKDKIYERGQKYYSKNKELINKKQCVKDKTLIKCDCGLMIRYGGKARHKRSAKHIKRMISLEKNETVKHLPTSDAE